MSTSAFDQSLTFNLTIFHYMTKTERRIACVFAWLYVLLKSGKHEVSHPSRIYISRKARCSETMISRFVSKYKPFIFKKVVQPKGFGKNGPKDFLANEYEYNPYFFEPLCLLKASGRVKIWDKIGDDFIRQASEDEELTKKILGSEFEVVRQYKSCGDARKSHTKDLRISTKSIYIRVPTNRVPYTEGVIRKASETIKVSNLSIPAKEFLDRFASPFICREINKDYEFSVHKQRKIYSPDGWVKNRFMAHEKYQSKILYSMLR